MGFIARVFLCIVVSFSVVLLPAMVAGCGNRHAEAGKSDLLKAGAKKKSSSQADAEEKSFPRKLAGRWKAQSSPWEIVINRYGKVRSTIFPFGTVEIKPNQVTKVQMRDGSFSVYKAGDITVSYKPETREMFVSVEVPEIHIAYLKNRIDGKTIDKFIGKVSEDGKTWLADHIQKYDLGLRFPQDQNDLYVGKVLFKKVDK